MTDAARSRRAFALPVKPTLALVTCLLLAVAPLWAQAPPSNRELLQQAWWTGPMLAPSAATLPRGHLLVEPYFYDVVTSPLSNTAGSLSYIEYGATDRLTVGLIPTFDYEWLPGGSRSTQLELGDFSLVGQYALRSYRLGHWAPALAFNFQESFPTGRYDRLGTHASDGFGAGVHTSMLSLFSQTFFWLPNGRILRARLNLSQSFSSTARVSGVSVYGTGPAFVGTAHPGAVSNADLGLEYSLTQRWVLALDAASRYQNRIQVRGFDPRAVALDSGAGEQVIFAPAVEYNVTSSLGFLCGLRLIEAGHNFTRSVTPAIAVDWAH